MGKKTTKKYYLPIDFPTPHIQDDPNMPYMKFEDGGNGSDQNEQMQKKQKGANFMQGMQGMSQSGGVGTIIGDQINEKTTDSRGYQDPMDARAAGYWQGTSKGAQMGSSFGPWGMLIGAAIGGTYGGISGNAKAKKKNKAIGAMQQEENASLVTGQVANPYARALGGPLPDMEGYNTYKGNTHENGGIPAGPNAEVETGEVNFNNYIYSDRLTLAGKKATFADMAKRIRAKYKGREEDKAGKISMERDLAELAKQNDMARVMKEQQDIIAQKTQELEDIAAYGGCIKYENGGLVLDEDAHNKLRRVAKKRGIELNELLTTVYANTQKFALGGYNDFSNQYNKETDDTLTNHYQDGGPNQKRTAAEWDTYNTKRGWQVDPRHKENASGYKPYYDPRALKIKPSTTHESGYEIEGVAPDAYNFGMISPKYHANYNYTAPIKPMTIGTGTPKVIPTSNRTAIGFDTMGTTYRDNTTGETYMLDKQGNKIQPLTKANGGLLPHMFGEGGFIDSKPLTLPQEGAEMSSKDFIAGQFISHNSNLPKLENKKVEKPYIKVNSKIEDNTDLIKNSPFSTKEGLDAVVNRQDSDYKKYHNFTKKGSDILNRTDAGRGKDSEIYIQDILKKSKDSDNVIIDIGSALGNKDSKLAGVTVKELYDNPNISKKSHIIATDIPSEIKKWNRLKDKYNIDVAEVSDKSFNTDVKSILKQKNLDNTKHVILRTANSIDLLMDKKQTVEHFNHLSSTLKDKELTYIFNNAVLHKNAGDNKFKLVAKLNNAGFAHNSQDWKVKKERVAYHNLTTESDYNKYAYGGKLLYNHGGPHYKEGMDVLNPNSNFESGNPYVKNWNDLNQLPASQSNTTNSKEYYDPNRYEEGATGLTIAEKKSNGFKFGNEEGALIASSLPAIYNLIKGSKADVTKFDRVKPEQISLSAQRKGITQEGDRAKRTALEIARSVGGGSGSVLAALSAMNSNINQQVMNRLSDSYASESNTNIGINNQAKYTNTNISMQEKIANEQNKAMSDSLIGSSMANLGTNAQLYSRDKKLSKTNAAQNEKYMQIINQLFPEYKWGQDPNSDKLMIQYVSTLKPTE